MKWKILTISELQKKVQGMGKSMISHKQVGRLKRAAITSNYGITPIVSQETCLTCGSQREHPYSGYCFDCDTDNWGSNNEW